VKFVQEISKKRLFELRKKATDKLGKLIAKDSKAISQISQLSDGTEESEKFKHYAEILISQPNAKAKFGNKAEFDDWDGSKISIPLDEKLTLIENSHKYFKKASSILKERAFAKNKLNGLIENVAVNKQLQEKIGTTDKLKELENLLFENRKIIGIMVEKQETQAKEDKFKKYMLSEGFVLYVGKNAKNNDELTLRFAKPNDIWLHARGVSGSHCVIRVDGREPSKGIIKEAAAIAAFYSKAKTSHLAPVAYTQKKYVSKPKGANPGAVVIRREEVILVEPFQPD
jgi:predicted ribosome quality control (RQC) complex YloA/Tae2 family protein